MYKARLGLLCLILIVGVRFQIWKKARTRTGLICSALSCLENRLNPLSLKGEVRLTPNGEGRLRNGDAVEIVLPATQVVRLAHFERHVQVRGQFHCAISTKNFSDSEDGLRDFKWVRWVAEEHRVRFQILEEKESLLSRLAVGWDAFLAERFRKTQGLLGFVRAVWTGATTGLPGEVLTLYRQAGLLPILALSGQHVNALLLLVHAGLRAVAPFFLRRSRHARLWYPHFLMALPFLCASLLGVSSDWTPSVVRTFGMAIALLILRIRRYSLTMPQLLCSSLAWVLFWDPSLISGAGFLLSATSTYLLIRIGTEQPGVEVYFEYAIVSMTMPVLVFPFTAFFFGKVSSLAPVSTFCIGWLWDLVLIPLGFLLPVLALLPEPWRYPLQSQLDAWWHQFISWHQKAGPLMAWGYVSVPRPSYLELLVIELGSLMLLIYLTRTANKMMLRIKYAAQGFDFWRLKVSNKKSRDSF